MRTTPRRTLTLSLIAGLTLLHVPVVAQAQATDPELATGILQVREGEFDAALITLDGVVKRLSQQKGQAKEIARAYTYLAIAYVGLAQQETAKAKFIEAWKADNGLTLSPKEFPPSIIELFNQARATEGGSKPPTQAGTAAAMPVKPPASGPGAKKAARSKTIPIVVGVAAVGGGIALAAKGAGGSSPVSPAVSITASPGGAITGVTAVAFSAIATSLSSPTFSWIFGDGGTASGTSVQHRFDSEGTFNVTVTAAGREGTVTAILAVISRTVTGDWVDWYSCSPDISCWTFHLVQQGMTVTGSWERTRASPSSGRVINGALAPPTSITFEQDEECRAVITGTLNDSLTEISGTEAVGMSGCSNQNGPKSFHRR